MADTSRYAPATNTVRGPLAIYASARYDQNITWSPTRDPEPAVVPYTLEVVSPAPAATTTLSGYFSITRGGYAQNLDGHPGENVYPIAPGTLTITFTIYGSDGWTSQTKSLTLS